MAVSSSPDRSISSHQVTPSQINILKAEWKETQQKLLGRKTELTAMLEHSDNLDTKGREVSDWLGKLERQLAGATVGRTRDILLAQIREVNQVMRELQKYSHHVTLFTQMCHRLVSIYSKDLTRWHPAPGRGAVRQVQWPHQQLHCQGQEPPDSPGVPQHVR